jgi:DNA-binding LytR/AlgR family response regulator
MTPLTSISIRERPNPQTRDRAAASKRPLVFFFIRHQGRNLKIRVADIDYIEARKNYCKIVTKKGAFLTIVTLKRMAEFLPPDEFCQIHRATIVSLDWLTAFDGHFVYGPSGKLPIGETFRRVLAQRVLLVGDELKLAAELRN